MIDRNTKESFEDDIAFLERIMRFIKDGRVEDALSHCADWVDELKGIEHFKIMKGNNNEI